MAEMNINPIEWSEAVGLARQAAARIFREGGSPEASLASFGLKTPSGGRLDWDRAIDLIAADLCARRRTARRAA